MYKVFKSESKNPDGAYYQIIHNENVNGFFEIVWVFFNEDNNEISLKWDFDRAPGNNYFLESVYDRVTDAMIHIKYELNLRDKLDQGENQ